MSKQPQMRSDNRATEQRRDPAPSSNEPTLEGVVIARAPNTIGHRTIYVRLPASVVERYKVREEPAELKSIVLERLARWLSEAR